MDEKSVVETLCNACVSNGVYLLTEPLLRHLGYRSCFKSANNSVKTVLRKNDIKHELLSRKEGRTIREYVQVDTNSFKHLLVLSRLPNSRKVLKLLCSMESEKDVYCSLSNRVSTKEESLFESTKKRSLSSSSEDQTANNASDSKSSRHIDVEHNDKRAKMSVKHDPEEDVVVRSVPPKVNVAEQKIDTNLHLPFKSGCSERQLISFVKTCCFQKFVPRLSESVCRSVTFKPHDLINAYERVLQIISSSTIDLFDPSFSRENILCDRVTSHKDEWRTSKFPIFCKAQMENSSTRQYTFVRTLRELCFADAEKFDFNDRREQGCFVVIKLTGNCSNYFSKQSDDTNHVLRDIVPDIDEKNYECWIVFSVYSSERLDEKLKEIAATDGVAYSLLAIYVIRYKPFLFNQILRNVFRRIRNERFVVKNECIIRAVEIESNTVATASNVAQSGNSFDDLSMVNILATVCSFFM